MVEDDLSPNSLSALRFIIAAVCFSPLSIKGWKDPALRLAALELGLWLFGELSDLCSAVHVCAYCSTQNHLCACMA